MLETIIYLFGLLGIPLFLLIFGGYIIIAGEREDARKRKAKKMKVKLKNS